MRCLFVCFGDGVVSGQKCVHLIWRLKDVVVSSQMSSYTVHDSSGIESGNFPFLRSLCSCGCGVESQLHNSQNIATQGATGKKTKNIYLHHLYQMTPERRKTYNSNCSLVFENVLAMCSTRVVLCEGHKNRSIGVFKCAHKNTCHIIPHTPGWEKHHCFNKIDGVSYQALCSYHISSYHYFHNM